MTDTIICAAEPESSGFHPEGKTGFSVRLSFETDIRILTADDEATRKAKEEAARLRFGNFLAKLASVKFALYRKTGATLTLSAFVQTSPQVSVDTDLSNYFFEWLGKSAAGSRIPFFATPAAAEQVSADDVGAVHVLQGASTWTAPLPQRLGLTSIVRFDSTDVEPGGAPLTDLVLVPFFDAAAPAGPYTVVDAAPFEFDYTSGLDGNLNRFRGSVIAGRLTPDPTSLVDTETGFVEGDEHSRAFYDVLKRQEQKAGSLLAAFPAVLGVEWAAVPAKDGQPPDADLVTFCRLVWRAITSVATSLDSIHIALTMPDARDSNPGREGPLLAPLVDRLLTRLESSDEEDIRKFHERPDEVLKALKTSIRQQIVFVQPAATAAARENYAAALAIVAGLRSVEGQVNDKAAPLLAAALKAFRKDPAADDLSAEIGELKVNIFGDARLPKEQLDALKAIPFHQLEISHAIKLNDRLSAELAPIADAVQSEDGVESTVLRVLGFGGFGTAVGAPIDDGFANALPPAQKAKLAAICSVAREEYQRFLADGFNGAEAVRQACSSVYADFLMNPRPDDVAMLKARLEASKLFRTRVDGTPAVPPPRNPDKSLVDLVGLLVDPARPWFDKGKGNADDGPETVSLRDGFDRAVEDLFPTEGTRRFIPAHAPPPLPLQITVDQNTAELDEFENLFAGIALLVRRSDKKDTTDKKDWAYANLAEIKINGNTGSTLPKPEVKGLFIHPAHTAETDGRRQLYLEYSGLPFTTSAFDLVVPTGPFFAIDYPNIPSELEFQRLPPLAYGTEIDVVGHVVSKGGVLPNPLQDSTDAPWKPKPIVESKNLPVPATPARSVIQTFGYSRLTAIGRTVITEEKDKPRRIGVAIAGVQPLAVDYPRSGLSSAHDVFLDVMRNGDGTGTITAPAVDAATKLQLKDVWCWSGKGTLQCTLLNLAGATPADEEGLKISVPVTPGELGSLELALRRKADDQNGKHVYAATVSLGGSVSSEQEVVLEHVPASFWLRLRLVPQTSSDALWISFADATLEIRDANTGSQPMPDNLALIADAAPSPKVWKPDVPAAISGRIELPRMGYLDFDRWLNNMTLRSEAMGTVNFDTFKSKLLTAYLMRGVAEDIAARLDRLPDLAVAGLLLELFPLDGLFASPGSLTTRPPFETGATVASMSVVLRLPTLGDRLKKLAPDLDHLPKGGVRALLKALDEDLSLPISCEAAGKKLGMQSEAGGIVVRIPEGMTVRLSVRPLIPTRYFDRTDDFASVIDTRVQQLACGRYTDANAVLGTAGETYLVFEGAALSVERMIGPVSFVNRAEDRPWQMQVDAEGTNEWADLVGFTLEEAHKPAGSARSYNVMLDPALPPARSPTRGWNWRQLASVDISTQRWRFTGRPIYNWIEPPAPAIGVASTEVKVAGTLSAEALAQFEKEAFFDRDDLDAEPRTVTLDPAPAITKVLNVEWDKASATLFRHRFSVRSRYAGAMTRVTSGVAPAWTRVDDDKPQSWFRVAMLADRARVQLTRPQLRALIPLTSTPGDRPSPTPPVLAVLQERPFDFGGLADRIGAEVRTGIGYEMKNPGTNNAKVGPADARKEGGPDPRLTYRTLDKQSASGLVLQAEGPVGLTFDSSSAPAPAFPNSMFVLQPRLLFGEAKRLDEHFVSVGLRRYLDPHWLTPAVPEEPTFEISWWHEFTGEDGGALYFRGPDGKDKRVCWIEVTAPETDVFTVYFNPKAMDKTADDASNATGALQLSKSKASTVSNFAFLHVPLENGRASLSVFALPSSGDVMSGAGDAPILLTSVDWSIPDDWKTLPLQIKPARKVPLTSASPVTALNWTRTSKDFDNIFVRRKAGPSFEDTVSVADMSANFDNGISFAVPDVSDLWALPEQWKSNFPLHTQRHLALLFSEASDGLGRPIEIVTSLHRLVGRNAVLKVASTPQFVRLIEFETPAAIIGYLPATGGTPANHGVPADYHAAYFDFKAIGFGNDKLSFKTSFFLRLVASSATRAGVKIIKLNVRLDNTPVASAIDLSIENESNKGVFGLYLDMEFKVAASTKCFGRILYDDGLLSDPVELNAAAALKLDPNTEGLVVKLVGLSTAGGEQEGWLEISMLASSPQAEAGPDRTTQFTFDWFFTGEDQPPETAISESGLRAMVEAQARLICMSPPIRVVVS